MKEYRLWLAVVVFLALLPGGEAGMQIQESSLEVGNSNFEKPSTPYSTSITLVNTNATLSITNLQASFSPKNNFNTADINVLAPQTLAPGSSTPITVEITLDAFDAVDDDLEERGQVDIGDLFLSGDENGVNVQTNTIPIRVEIENDLEIAKIDWVDEDGNTQRLSEGSSYTIVEDENVELQFTIRNVFSANGLKLENVEITVTSDDLEIDEDTSIAEIEAGNEEDAELSFSVDVIDRADVEVRVEGEDELGGRHGERFTFKFDVEEKEEEPEEEPEEEESTDEDGDGIDDFNDLCPNTVSVCSVDSNGCPIDADDDGICDDLDSTPLGEREETTQEKQVQTSGRIDPAREENTEQEKISSAEEDTDGLIPFLIGFFIGILLTAGFFSLIRS